jgi:hypothetical protein
MTHPGDTCIPWPPRPSRWCAASSASATTGANCAPAPGTRLRVPPGVAHDVWNDGAEEARVVVEVQPGERFVQLIRQLFRLAQDGRTDQRGRPRPLRAAVLGREFADTIQFTTLPRPFQRLLAAALYPIARATGHRALDPASLRRELPTVDLEPLPAEIAGLIPSLSRGRGGPTRPPYRPAADTERTRR